MRILHYDHTTQETVEFRSAQEYKAFVKQRVYPDWWLPGYCVWLREREQLMQRDIVGEEEEKAQ